MLMFTTELFNLIHLFFLQPGTKQKVAACKEQGATNLRTWSRKFKLLWSSAACFHLDCIQCIFHICTVYTYTYIQNKYIYIHMEFIGFYTSQVVQDFFHQQNVLAERVFFGSAGLCGLRTQLFLFKANGAVAVHIVNRVSWCFMHAKCKENLVSQKTKATTSLIRTFDLHNGVLSLIFCCSSWCFTNKKTGCWIEKKATNPFAPPTKFPPQPGEVAFPTFLGPCSSRHGWCGFFCAGSWKSNEKRCPGCLEDLSGILYYPVFLEGIIK